MGELVSRRGTDLVSGEMIQGFSLKKFQETTLIGGMLVEDTNR